MERYDRVFTRKSHRNHTDLACLRGQGPTGRGPVTSAVLTGPEWPGRVGRRVLIASYADRRVAWLGESFEKWGRARDRMFKHAGRRDQLPNVR